MTTGSEKASEKMETCYHHSQIFDSPKVVGVPEGYVESVADGCKMADIHFCTNEKIVSEHGDRALTKEIYGAIIDDPAKLCRNCRKYGTGTPQSGEPLAKRSWMVDCSELQV